MEIQILHMMSTAHFIQLHLKMSPFKLLQICLKRVCRIIARREPSERYLLFISGIIYPNISEIHLVIAYSNLD
jgi:hypothetical protein